MSFVVLLRCLGFAAVRMQLAAAAGVDADLGSTLLSNAQEAGHCGLFFFLKLLVLCASVPRRRRLNPAPPQTHSSNKHKTHNTQHTIGWMTSLTFLCASAATA